MSTLKSISYILQRFVLRRSYLTAAAGPLKFRVKTEDVVGRHIYKYGRHEPELTRWLNLHIKPQDGDLLIDIGANIGWYALLFEMLSERTDAEVHAFEPAPENVALLRQNLAMNQASHVTVHEIGLSDNDAGGALHLFSDANRGRHSLLPINDHDSVNIPTARLDDVLQTIERAGRPVRVMKIDIEGYELVALRGAPQTLAQCQTLITEFSPQYMRKGGLDPHEMLAYLHSLGFSANLLRDGALTPITQDELLQADRQCDIVWQRA